MNKTILIIAGQNTLAYYTALLFAKQNYQIVLIEKKVHCLDIHPYITCVMADYGSDQTLHSLFQQYSFDAVIHCALYDSSNDIATQNYYDDIHKTITLIIAMQKYSLKKLIFASCVSVYGKLNGCITTNMPCQPLTSLAKCKKIVEDIIADYAALYYFSFAILRLFNVPCNFFYQDYEDNQIIKIINAVQQEKPIIIPKTFQPPDNSPLYDYLHVWDAAYAIFKAYEYLTLYDQSDYFTIGSSIGSSTLEIVNKVQTITHKKAIIIPQDQNQNEPTMQIADISKAIDILRWQPRYSELSYLLETTVSFLLTAQDFYKNSHR